MSAERRPNVHAEVLLAAAQRYGDAQLRSFKIIHAWTQGTSRDEMDAASKAHMDAEHELRSAAKAYATRMRRKAPGIRPTPQTTGEG